MYWRLDKKRSGIKKSLESISSYLVINLFNCSYHWSLCAKLFRLLFKVFKLFKIFKKLFVHFSESDAWELELEPLIESHMMWVLGTKLRCSPRQNVLLMA